jgi:hypothetical protein
MNAWFQAHGGFRGRIMADKIVFVDDGPAVRDGDKGMLHREFPVSTATGGEEGLTVGQKQGQEVDKE